MPMALLGRRSRLAVMTLTIEVALHHTAHGHAGKGSKENPVFNVLPGDFWPLLETVFPAAGVAGRAAQKTV
jgi:hypothetical protein